METTALVLAIIALILGLVAVVWSYRNDRHATRTTHRHYDAPPKGTGNDD